MKRFLLMVRSRPKQGREDEYNRWYDDVHIAEVCRVPGFVAARRFNEMKGRTGWPDLPYLALYEIEADDPQVPIAELHRRISIGEIQSSDALDHDRSVSWVYEQR